MPQVVHARVPPEPGALPNEVPDVPECGEVLAWLVAGEYPLALALRPQPIDERYRAGLSGSLWVFLCLV